MKKIVNKTKINKKELIRVLNEFDNYLKQMYIPIHRFRFLRYEIVISKRIV